MIEKFEGSYKCPWPGCGLEFKATFGQYTAKGKGRQNGTSAVRCPRCGHNLKPVLDAVKVQKIKEGPGK